MTHYNELIRVDEDYTPCMDRNAIDAKPNTWLLFYPHNTFVKFLKDIVSSLDGGNRSVWLTGGYGTGKTHAALVLQKLYMDDEARVMEWFKRRSKEIPEELVKLILKQRKNGVLAVFDSESSGITTPRQLLVRLDRAISRQLKQMKFIVPPKGAFENIITRVREEGDNFFTVRDQMQDQLAYLTSDIKNVDSLEKRLRSGSSSACGEELLSDINRVLEEREIFLDISTRTFLSWVDSVLEKNKLSKMLFIWDEFSDYIINNANALKPFEELGEAARSGHFYLVPVTHMELSAYTSEKADNYKKANDRFKFDHLEMPTDTAILLAGDAIKPIDENRWNEERTPLWYGVNGIVEQYMCPRDAELNADHFKGIIPLHPITAYILKYLSTLVGSNQRSMFNFLKGKDTESEFQKFLTEGGPDVREHQYLTVDRLWHYFVERDELGTSDNVVHARIEYTNKSKNLDANQIRVFKAVLLYSLLSNTVSAEGNDLLQPTIDNVVQSFSGDYTMVNVEETIRTLSDQYHCFSIMGKRCEMFRSSFGGEKLKEEVEKLYNSFPSIILGEKTRPALDKKVKSIITENKLRYDVQVASSNATVSTIRNKDLYNDRGNKIQLLFLLARNHEEELTFPEKANSILETLHDHRIIVITVPSLTFCSEDTNLWDEYLEKYVLARQASNAHEQAQYEELLKTMYTSWNKRICQSNQKLHLYVANIQGKPFEHDITWEQLNAVLANSCKVWFPNLVDSFSGYNSTAYGLPKNLKNWALAGLKWSNFQQHGAWSTVWKTCEKMGVNGDSHWFDDHQDSSFTALRDFCKKKIDNAMSGKGSSIWKLFRELSRPPFGLLQIPFSAFVLGFVLKGLLSQTPQLQWSDGVTTKQLDEDALSDIIAAAVGENSDSRPKGEKLICRLSPSEKEFIKQSTVIFDLEPTQDASVQTTLNSIVSKLDSIARRIPFWVLKDSVNSQEASPEPFCQVIDCIFTAIGISSRGEKYDDRTQKVRDAGEILSKTPGLAEALAKYINSSTFEQAFIKYVENTLPELTELAQKVGDKSGTYCDEIKKLLAAKAASLWNPNVLKEEMDYVLTQYHLIESYQLLSRRTGFVSFEDAWEQMRYTIVERNKIPLVLVSADYPELKSLFTNMVCTANTEQLRSVLEDTVASIGQNMKCLQMFFFDPDRTQQLELFSRMLGADAGEITMEEKNIIYGKLSSCATRSEDEFQIIASEAVSEYRHQSLASQITKLWQDKTGTSCPDNWSAKYKFPAVCLFENFQIAEGFLEVISNVTEYSESRLMETLSWLKSEASGLVPDETSDAATRFMERFLPSRYVDFAIRADELACAFSGYTHDMNPNKWWGLPNRQELVDRFIQSHYQAVFKPRAIDRIAHMTEKEAKSLLLKLVENIPDAGLVILEGEK